MEKTMVVGSTSPESNDPYGAAFQRVGTGSGGEGQVVAPRRRCDRSNSSRRVSSGIRTS